jgi:hypothetical protein
MDEYTLQSDLGQLSEAKGITPNRSEYLLKAGNVPGTATVKIKGFNTSVEVVLEAPPPIGAQLHLHGPVSEGDATHAWQMAEADAYNVGVLWWTDHDYRYWNDWFTDPEWESGVPLLTTASGTGGREAWWSPTVSTDASASVQLDELNALDDLPTLSLETTVVADPSEEWTSTSVSWMSTGRRIYRPLIANVTVGFSVLVPSDFDPNQERVRLEIPLSRTDSTTVASLWFVSPNDTGLLPPGAIPIATSWNPGEWTPVLLNISDFASTNLENGTDHTLRGLNLYLESTKSRSSVVNLGDVSITHQHEGDDLRARQSELLAELPGTTTNFIGQEVSYDTTDTLHFNAYGASVPWMDYGRLNLKTQATEIVNDIHEYGGIASFNHPFGVFLGLSDVDNPESLVQSTCEWLDRENIYGADLIEIGYPERHLDFQSHLELWDCLLRRGHFNTAIGTSDQHVTQEWAEYANNFITWAFSKDPTEADLMTALAAGRAYFGNPTLTFSARPSVDLLVPGRGAMGQIIDELPEEPITIEAHLSGLDPEDELRWIVDSVLVDARTNLGSSEIINVSVNPGTWTYARVEVYTKAGQPKLFSNPIFLSTLTREIPWNRRPMP